MSELTETTINDYTNKIRYLSKYFNNKEIKSELIYNYFKNKKGDLKSELEFLNLDDEEIIMRLEEKYTMKKSLIVYLNVIFVLKRMMEMDVEILKRKIKELSNEIIDERELNLINDKEIIDLDINEIETNLNKLSNELDRVIYGLYTILPPRRLDYRYLKLIKREEDLLKETEYNYIHLKNDSIMFVFNEYKTKYKYNQQQFIFYDRLLAFILKDYIEKNNINDGELLFKNKKGEILPYYSFSKLIQRVFNKIYNKKITMNDIRHSWANKINEQIQIKTLKEITEITNYMGHSVIENLKYRRLV